MALAVRGNGGAGTFKRRGKGEGYKLQKQSKESGIFQSLSDVVHILLKRKMKREGCSGTMPASPAI